MTRGKGKYVQIQVYVSDYNERLIGRELARKGMDMATFLDEIKGDAIAKAKRNLGLGD